MPKCVKCGFECQDDESFWINDPDSIYCIDCFEKWVHKLFKEKEALINRFVNIANEWVDRFPVGMHDDPAGKIEHALKKYHELNRAVRNEIGGYTCEEGATDFQHVKTAVTVMKNQSSMLDAKNAEINKLKAEILFECDSCLKQFPLKDARYEEGDEFRYVECPFCGKNAFCSVSFKRKEPVCPTCTCPLSACICKKEGD